MIIEDQDQQAFQEHLGHVINEIWENFDADNSGALDKQETKNFIGETLGMLQSDKGFESVFEEVFATFDKDKSGCIEKPEMAELIQNLL